MKNKTNVFLHTWDIPGADSVNEGREFLRLPVVGEYLAKEATGAWYEVTLVVHCPFGGTYSAEVYARKVDHNKVLKAKGAWRRGRFTADVG